MGTGQIMQNLIGHCKAFDFPILVKQKSSGVTLRRGENLTSYTKFTAMMRIKYKRARVETRTSVR